MSVFLALAGSGKMMSPFFLSTFSDRDTMSKLKFIFDQTYRINHALFQSFECQNVIGCFLECF